MIFDNKKITRLRLLEAINEDKACSQREFSKKLNISLGLVNTFIKQFVNKGYCKISSIPKNRMKYILTSKGLSEKTKLKYEYFLHSYRYFKDSREKIIELFNGLERSDVKNIVFWGTGELAEIAFPLLSETSLKLVGIVDTKRNNGKKYLGLYVIEPGRIKELEFDRIIYTDIPIGSDFYSNLPDGVSRNLICFLL